MSFFDLFMSKSEKERLSHLRNLISVAAIDGKIEESEMNILAKVASREGMSEYEFRRCLENPGSVKFVVPNSDEKCRQFLLDLVVMMMVDGDIDEKEIELCKVIAVGLGYKPEVVHALILGLIVKVREEIENRKQNI